jgi:hypothetical protein
MRLRQRVASTKSAGIRGVLKSVALTPKRLGLGQGVAKLGIHNPILSAAEPDFRQTPVNQVHRACFLQAAASQMHIGDNSLNSAMRIP